MTIDWWTLAFQAINFLILAWLLQRFLYRPVLAVLDRRRRESEEARSRLAAAQKAADDAHTGWEQKQRDLTAERDALVQQTRARLENERQEVLAGARSEAEAIVAATRRSLEEERAAAVAGLYDRAVDLAAEMAAGLLDRTAAADADSLLFDRLAGHLAGLPASERDTLKAQLDGAPLRVVTARPVPPPAAEAWRGRLQETLGDGRLVFETDPALIAGVELRFPHAVLRFTWRGALDDMRAALQRD